MKIKMRDESGNSSLFFLLLLPVTMFILFLNFENAQLRRDELDFVRACETGLDLTLADFDRKLWHEFGLWGIESSLLNQHKNEIEQNYIEDVYPANIELTATSHLDTTEILRNQILRHMSIRGPFLISDEIVARFNDIQSLGQMLSVSDIFSKIDSNENYIDPDLILKNPDIVATNPDKINIEISDEDQEKLSDLSDEEIDQLTDSSLSILSDVIVSTKELVIPIYETMGNEIPSDPIAPNSIHKIAAFADDFLFNYDLPIISRIQIQEYMFNYYTMQCSQLELNSSYIQIQTPDGRLHSDLTTQGRKNEVEQIIFDNDSPDHSAEKANQMIKGICFIYHLTNNYLDQTKQGIYLAEATTMSTVIAVASLGHIIIEPQPLVYLFMLIDSLSEAATEVENLIAGQEIKYSISNISFDLNYRDFLRFFALFKSEESLLNNLNRVRKDLIPGDFITGIELEASFRNSYLSLNREFSDNVAE